MKSIIVIIATLVVITIIFSVTRCDVYCQATNEVKKAQEQKEIFEAKTSEAGLLQKQLDELLKEATIAKMEQWKHEKNAEKIYSGVALNINVAYAGWDDGLIIVETGHSDRDLILMDRICKHGKLNGSVSPLCDNWDMYYTGKKIFEDRDVPYGIALGIMFAESHIGVNYAGSCDSSRNNRGGIKWKKNDDGSNTKDQKIPNAGNCWLYKFDTIEEYFKSKANTLGIGYKSCFTTDAPIRCISYAYVGNRYVAEESRIYRVSLIAQ